MYECKHSLSVHCTCVPLKYRWGIFTERNGNGTHVPEVNVCIHILAKLLATHHYKYNSTSTKKEIDQTPGPVLLARSSLACH